MSQDTLRTDLSRASFEEAKRVIGELQRRGLRVGFDVASLTSTDRAVQEVDHVIDEALGPHKANPYVAAYIDDLKRSAERQIRCATPEDSVRVRGGS